MSCAIPRCETASNFNKTGMGAVVEMAAPALSKALQPKTELEQERAQAAAGQRGL